MCATAWMDRDFPRKQSAGGSRNMAVRNMKKEGAGYGEFAEKMIM